VSRKVLIHVEDPGAANWILPVLPALKQRGVAVALLAEGAAVDYLKARGVRDFASEADVAVEAADFVLVGTSENLASRGLALIDRARASGVPCAAVVDQAVNAEHRFRGLGRDPLRHLPDWVFLPHAQSAERFMALGAQSERCIVVGNPHHDRVLAAGRDLAREGRAAVRSRVLPQAPGGRPVVVFVSEVGYVVNPEAERWQAANGFAGRGATRARSAVVLEEVLDACAAMTPRPFLVLRLHPKNRPEEFAPYSGELDAISQGDDPLALVYAADLVIGMTSALLEEAAMLGRRALAALPRPEEREWLTMVADGRIPHVLSRQQLRAALPALLLADEPRPSPATTGAAARIAEFVVSQCGHR
jgi:hypothetical protein